MTFQSGELVFDKFRIETFLGKGTLGDVYRITNENLNVLRALKVLMHDGIGVGSVDYNNARQRFKLEAQLGARLNSPNENPNLLQVYEYIETNDGLALEMEYAPGGNLTDQIQKYISKSIPFPKEKALKVAFEIASGLTALHDLDIVHRDLKPANILFDENNHARIADLGMAQILGGPNLRSLLSISNMHPGSFGYMSPEQRLSSTVLTPSSDVYALALVLFEMLTGQNYSIVRPRTLLSDLIPGIKPSLNDLLARMLSEFPRDRPLDGREVAAELHKELIAEEQAQRVIQAEKRHELEEWERLKNEELARREEKERVHQDRRKKEDKEATRPVMPENDKPDQQKKESGPLETQGLTAILSRDMKEEPHETNSGKGLEGESNVSTDKFQSDFNQPSILKRFWWIGIIIIVGIASIPFLTNRTHAADTLIDTIEPSKTVEITRTSIHIPTQTFDEKSNIPVQLPTLTPYETQTLAKTSTPIETMTLPQPTAVKPLLIPTVSPEILLNPGFEDSTGWASKPGDAHIIGKYSTKWASQGSKSYQISLFGNQVYEYCFLPGMRTTVNQNVNLSSVDEVLFDIYIRPPVIKGGFHGDVVRALAVAFIDGEQIYLSGDNDFGEFLDQKLVINKKYSGKHEIKFGFMVKSKFCVKGTSEDESLLLFIDNIRFLYR